MNMSAMGAMAGMGGPGAPVAPGMANSGTPANAPTQKDIRTKFHTFIYDYFVKTNRFELARTILTQMEIESESPQKPSPNRKEVNGDSDSKEDVKRPDDLPNASVPSHTDSPFLYDWFCQFWDLFEAQRGKGSQASRTFLGASQVSTCASRLCHIPSCISNSCSRDMTDISLATATYDEREADARKPPDAGQHGGHEKRHDAQRNGHEP